MAHTLALSIAFWDIPKKEAALDLDLLLSPLRAPLPPDFLVGVVVAV